MLGHGPGDGDLQDPGFGMVGHKAHGQRNHGCGDGVHGDGVHGDDAYGDGVHGDGVRGDDAYGDGAHGDDAHEEGVHGDGAHWNYDYEGVHGSHWDQNGGDDILDLEVAIVEELLPEMVVCLLGEVGIQIYVACGDDGDLLIHQA